MGRLNTVMLQSNSTCGRWFIVTSLDFTPPSIRCVPSSSSACDVRYTLPLPSCTFRIFWTQHFREHGLDLGQMRYRIVRINNKNDNNSIGILVGRLRKRKKNTRKRNWFILLIFESCYCCSGEWKKRKNEKYAQLLQAFFSV